MTSTVEAERYCYLCHRDLPENEFDRTWRHDVTLGANLILKMGHCNICLRIKRWRDRSASFRYPDAPLWESIWGRDLFDMWHEQKGRCAYCKGLMLFESECEIDHKIPKSKGGTHARENLVIACARCNRSKGFKLLEDWRIDTSHVIPDEQIIERFLAETKAQISEEFEYGTLPDEKIKALWAMHRVAMDAKLRAGLIVLS